MGSAGQLARAPVQRDQLIPIERKTELFIAHAQPLARYFADDLCRTLECRLALDQRHERTATAVFVADLVEQNFVKNFGDFAIGAVFFELAANLIQRAAATFGQRDRGAFENLVLARISFALILPEPCNKVA